MSKLYEPAFAEPKGALIRPYPSTGILMAQGAGVPTASAAGYSKGCIYIDTTNGAVYQNTGTVSSATWVQLPYSDATPSEVTRAADVSARVVAATASTLTVTVAEHEGRIIELDRAAGIAVTLPSLASCPGAVFKFRVKTTFTGAASIKSVAGTDIMVGHALMGNNTDNSVVDWQALASNTYDTIDLFGTANSTGGIEGQEIELVAGTGRWYVSMRGDAAGTEATPFADTVA